MCHFTEYILYHALISDWLYTDNGSSLCPQKLIFMGWISSSRLLYTQNTEKYSFFLRFLDIYRNYTFPMSIHHRNYALHISLFWKITAELLQFHMYIKFYRRKKCDYTLFLILLLQILQFPNFLTTFFLKNNTF